MPEDEETPQGRALAMGEKQFRMFEPDLQIRSAAQGGDGRTVYGIAVPYNLPQRINRKLREAFAPGVCAHQMRAASRISFAHGHIPLGGILLGRTLEMRDDAAGLYGEWRVSKTKAGDEALELINDGALNQLSVGFRERPDGNQVLQDGTVLRTKVDLFEVAAVPAGAYGDAATIAGVRSLNDDTLIEDIPAQLRRDRAAQIIANLPHLSLTAELESRASQLQVGNGRHLWKYWTHGEGLARWITSPTPWTTLESELAKEGVPASQIPGLVTNIMLASPGGKAIFAAHHGSAARH